MVLIQEWFLNSFGLTWDEFDIIWIILLIAGVIIAGISVIIHKRKKNWLSEAQKRQNTRYEYTDPVKPKTEKKWNPDGWYFDEEKGRWISPDYKEARKNTSMSAHEEPKGKAIQQRKEVAPDFSTKEMKWSPGGWYWDEKKGKWISPDYKDASANTNMPTYEEKHSPPQSHNQWTNDWVYNASARQNNRYEYTDPVKPKKGWVYNERARMWVDGDQFDQEQHQRAYEENRRKWAAYKAEEDAKEAEHWEEIETKKRIERHQREVLREMNNFGELTPEEKELAKQIKIDRSQPTFEEWKAAKEQEQEKANK